MKTPSQKRVIVWVYPEIREQLKVMADREDRTMRAVLERAIRNENKRTGKHSEAA